MNEGHTCKGHPFASILVGFLLGALVTGLIFTFVINNQSVDDNLGDNFIRKFNVSENIDTKNKILIPGYKADGEEVLILTDETSLGILQTESDGIIYTGTLYGDTGGDTIIYTGTAYEDLGIRN